MFEQDFAGKTLLSTGAASGMGLLICKEFLKYGGNVVLADIDEKAMSCWWTLMKRLCANTKND